MTIPDYNMMIEALEYRWVDDDHERHHLAYLNFMASAKKKSGNKEKPVYPTFKKFFDYEKEIERVKNKDKQGKFSEYSKHLREKQNGSDL